MTMRWLGGALVGLTAVGGWFSSGKPGMWAAAGAGSVALIAHLMAARVVRRKLNAEVKELAGAFAAGMAIRLAGVVVVVAAVILGEGRVPPGPTLFGYAAVLAPMLFMEMRFLK